MCRALLAANNRCNGPGRPRRGGTDMTPETVTVDELLSQARALLPHRPAPAEALGANAAGALLADIRGDDQRRDYGLIPGAILLPRSAGVALRSGGPVAAPRDLWAGSAPDPDLPGGVRFEPGRGQPATARPFQRHRSRRWLRGVGRRRAAGHESIGGQVCASCSAPPRPMGTCSPCSRLRWHSATPVTTSSSRSRRNWPPGWSRQD